MMPATFVLDRANPHFASVLTRCLESINKAMHAGPHVVTIKEPTRSLEQNCLLWALLSDISDQVEWPVDGRLQKLPAEDWKHILTAGLRKENRIAQGIGGGFVLLGCRTSKMSKRELSELVEFIHAFGAEHGVSFSEQVQDGRYE